jgi:putative flavoprotein involved in K+ transport
MPAEAIDTLVIGGGQAGLAMSHHLKRRGLPHLVLERGRIGERWRSERWDGLKFQFPNWSVRLPDFPFPHDDPDGFADLSAIVDFIDAYAGVCRAADPLRRERDAVVA